MDARLHYFVFLSKGWTEYQLNFLFVFITKFKGEIFCLLWAVKKIMEEIFHFKKKIDSQNTSINFFNPIQCQGNVHPTNHSIYYTLFNKMFVTISTSIYFINNSTRQFQICIGIESNLNSPTRKINKKYCTNSTEII